MTSGHNTGNFTSYVTDEALNSSKDAMQNEFQPKLLEGEIEAARAKNVSLYIAQKKKTVKGQKIQEEKLGTLIITNFRLSFTLFDGSLEDVAYQENNFLGKYDISLSNIDKIYQISDKKKRPVGPDYRNSSKVDAIRIICKNFRLLTFDFSVSDVGKGKHIADALLRFAFPSQHQVLFLYNYKLEYYNAVRSVRMFNQENDWMQELERCGASNHWRVLGVLGENIEDTLPRYYVVPKCLTNHEYLDAARSFQKGRAAIWVWGTEQAALVRMASLLDTIGDTTVENRMLESIRKCDPQRRQPHLVELEKILPSIQDVYHSYIKLRELCAPESDRSFMIQDTRFYTSLEKSSWLLHVSLCIQYSSELAKRMTDGETVVIQESEGRDMCCIISCLIQLLLDPYFRTINGFQTLIQKDWVSLGHPFSDRFGHVSKKLTTDQGALFLLFLDCTWQLLQQFPDCFEFSETFLTTVWDSVFLPIFDTFQFNCERDREKAVKDSKIVLRPVWDWGEQFSDKDIALFSNPLYKKPLSLEQDSVPDGGVRKSRIPAGALLMPGAEDLRQQFGNAEKLAVPRQPQSARLSRNIQLMRINTSDVPENDRLVPRSSVRDLEIWSQCYFRWMPMLEIKNGGFPQVDLFNRMLVNKIHRLQRFVSEQFTNFNHNRMSTNSVLNNSIMDTSDTQNEGQVVQIQINSFFPFTSYTGNSAELTDILTSNGALLADGSICYDTASLAYQYTD
ncbi:myotubularin-related protein 10 [Culicoides brevitarsis]|uniref:myotubularin-related protein 10 n=1 Tax=Culicoides brevitarsis TaxID=469753 RepID=UPI00307BD87A